MNTIIPSAIAPRNEEETQNIQLKNCIGSNQFLLKNGGAKEHEKLISREDLATKWGICVETLKRWEKAGHLPYLKIGKQVRYRLSVIEMIEKGSEVLP